MHLDLLNLMRFSWAHCSAYLGPSGWRSIPQALCTPQLGVISKLAEGALNPTVDVTDADIKEYWPQHQPLEDTTLFSLFFFFLIFLLFLFKNYIFQNLITNPWLGGMATSSAEVYSQHKPKTFCHRFEESTENCSIYPQNGQILHLSKPSLCAYLHNCIRHLDIFCNTFF